MSDLEQILKGFNHLEIDQLNAGTLLDRRDIKFTFPEEKLPLLLRGLAGEFNCYEVGSFRIRPYSTVYYDTTDLKFYFKHHNGHLNRLKVRKRHYLDNNLCFLEVKHKNNKGRTGKKRMITDAERIDFVKEEKNFLMEECGMEAGCLSPVLKVDYHRISLTNIHRNERLSFDLGLRFRAEGKEIACDRLVIAELKHAVREHSPVTDLIHDLGIRENSVSKYCMGMALLYKELKQNNFKPGFRFIHHQLQHDLITSHN